MEKQWASSHSLALPMFFESLESRQSPKNPYRLRAPLAQSTEKPFQIQMCSFIFYNSIQIFGISVYPHKRFYLQFETVRYIVLKITQPSKNS